MSAPSPDLSTRTAVVTGATSGLATSPEVEGASGRYFASCKEIRSTPQTYDEDVARRLWQESERLTGIAGSS